MKDKTGESLLYLAGDKKPQKLRKVIEDLQAASGSGITDGDKGDVVVSGSGSVWSVPDLSTKQNTITATTTADYYRGDKTFQPLNKSAVGLGNVDNTSDADKPISTATATALSGKSGTGHGHAISDVSGLQTALDGKQATGSYAAATHTHAQSDVTGLEAALADRVRGTVRITVGATEPVNPSVNDIWIDTN